MITVIGRLKESVEIECQMIDVWAVWVFVLV